MHKHIMLAVLAMLSVAPLTARAEVAVVAGAEVDVTYFYDALAPDGTWVNDATYGWVWQPKEVVGDADWQPYLTGGHWIYTDSGYYWESDYKWGWATFHYGRWARIHGGWAWVPGCTWGPAWVSWRECDDAYGWAPLPPGCEFDAKVGFSWRGGHVAAGFEFGLVEADFCFVPCGFFLNINCWRHRCGHVECHKHFGRCVVRNEYRFHEGHLRNEGCHREHVEKHWGHRLESKHVEDMAARGERGEHVTGRSVQAFRPRVKNEAPRNPEAVIKERHEREAARKSERIERRKEEQHKAVERREQRVEQRHERVQERQKQAQERREQRQERHHAAPPPQPHPQHHH